MATMTTLSAKGQVVIPSDIRLRMGLRQGDRFEVNMEDGTIVLRPKPRDPLLALAGTMAGSQSLTDALVQDRQKERTSDRPVHS